MAETVKKASTAKTPRKVEPAKTATTKAATKKSAPGKTSTSKAPGIKVVAKKAAPKKDVRTKVTAKMASHEEIAMLAHRFWAERGGHHGHHEDDWYRAEQALLGKAS
jgi:hypothetical protein